MDPNQTRDMLRRNLLRQLAKTDFYAFQEYVFGYKPAPHIRQMVEFVEERIARGENGVVLAPRGSTKTTSLTTGWLAHKVAQNTDIRIGLFSQKDKKAEAMSNAIRWTIGENESFREVFGNLRGESKWSDAEWLRKGSRWTTSKDRTMVTGGVNNSLGGVQALRPDLLRRHPRRREHLQHRPPGEDRGLVLEDDEAGAGGRGRLDHRRRDALGRRATCTSA